ncbi:MAG: PKD domain-containing protein [Planctomycetota bacterium]
MKTNWRFLSFALLLVSAPAFAVFDDFDDDPLTNPEWEFYDPLGQSQTLTQDGFFRYTFPAGVVMDHWTGFDNAAQLRRSDFPEEDWIMETRLNFVGSGDPEAPVWPPVNEAYQAGLMVAFGQFDLFYFGPYRSTALWLERSGQNGLCIVDPGLQELSLQVKKIGTTYTFSYRATDEDEWTPVCSRTVDLTPLNAGLVFKSWNPVLTVPETFDFDYFRLEAIPEVVPALVFPCPLGDPDRAWLDMPYVRDARVVGYPEPTVTVTSGPEGLGYNAAASTISGWTPDAPVAVPVEIELSNSAGTTAASWTVDVAASSSLRDDDFDADPGTGGVFELYEPQAGVAYSVVADGEENWWRLEVPQVGSAGLSFDTWISVDRAPQLRRPVDPAADFLIETRVRIPPEGKPAANAAFLAGLMVGFERSWDLVTWSVGGERLTPVSNVFAERSGTNNLCNSYAPGLLDGKPVELRIEKKCDVYRFYFRGSEDLVWTYSGSYRTADLPRYVGLVMKTWGAGVAWTVDFDYFDFVEAGPKAIFTVTPEEGTEPLEVTVDGTASTSEKGAIVEYLWDFGDGYSDAGATRTHVYDRRGEYIVRLTVKDATGDEGTASKVVRVAFRTEEIPPWISSDVGDPVLAGGLRAEGPGCVRVLAGGADIAGTADECLFLHQPLAGDGTLIARLSSATWKTSAKIGVMMREDLSPGSPHVSMLFTAALGAGKYAFVRRESAGSVAKSKASTQTFTPPDAWVKLERTGDEFVGSWSPDGTEWTELERVTLALPETLEVGLAAAARDVLRDGSELEALVCDFELKRPGGPEKPVFHRGDANGDGSLDISDGTFILNFLFLGGPAPGCLEAANPNDDGGMDISDGVYVLNYLFLGGPAPLPPGPPEEPCGPDPEDSASDLGCETYERC